MTLEEQIAALTASVNEGRAATESKFNALQASFDNWKPVVAYLQGQVEALRIRIDRYAPYFEGSSTSTPMTEAEANQGGRTVMRPTDGVVFSVPSGPSGHHLQHNTGGSVLGPIPGTVPPFTGANILPRSDRGVHDSYEGRDHRNSHHNWALPKLLSSGKQSVKSILQCMGCRLSCGYGWLRCISPATPLDGCKFMKSRV
jgi:hypothetical protein